MLSDRVSHSATILNALDGRSYSIDDDGLEQSDRDRAYDRFAQSARSHYGFSTRARVQADSPWDQSSCGPNALMFNLELVNRPHSLRQILEALPPQCNAASDVSVADLVAACDALGVSCTALMMSTYVARRIDRPFIARIAGETTPHFAVVEFDAGQVFLTSPPSDRIESDDSTFNDVFLGEVMIVAHDDEELSRIMEDAHRAAFRRSKLRGLVAPLVIGGLITLSWSAQRRRRRKSDRSRVELDDKAGVAEKGNA